MSSRQVLEQYVRQGVDEQIVYSLLTTPWGSTPTGVVVTVYDVTYNDLEDVTSTVTTGSATVSGDEITLPVIHSLTRSHVYRVEIQFTAGGNVFETYFLIYAEL